MMAMLISRQEKMPSRTLDAVGMRLSFRGRAKVGCSAWKSGWLTREVGYFIFVEFDETEKTEDRYADCAVGSAMQIQRKRTSYGEEGYHQLGNIQRSQGEDDRQSNLLSHTQVEAPDYRLRHHKNDHIFDHTKSTHRNVEFVLSFHTMTSFDSFIVEKLRWPALECIRQDGGRFPKRNKSDQYIRCDVEPCVRFE